MAESETSNNLTVEECAKCITALRKIIENAQLSDPAQTQPKNPLFLWLSAVFYNAFFLSHKDTCNTTTATEIPSSLLEVWYGQMIASKSHDSVMTFDTKSLHFGAYSNCLWLSYKCLSPVYLAGLKNIMNHKDDGVSLQGVLESTIQDLEATWQQSLQPPSKPIDVSALVLEKDPNISVLDASDLPDLIPDNGDE